MRSLVAIACIAAALTAPAIARADGNAITLLGAPHTLAAIGMSWSSTLNSVMPQLLRFSLPSDDVSRGRRSYEILASLPVTESRVRTYDVRPVVNMVFGRTLAISPMFALTFVRGRNLLVADLGGSTQVGVAPTGFGFGGGLLSLSSSF